MIRDGPSPLPPFDKGGQGGFLLTPADAGVPMSWVSIESIARNSALSTFRTAAPWVMASVGAWTRRQHHRGLGYVPRKLGDNIALQRHGLVESALIVIGPFRFSFARIESCVARKPVGARN